MSPRALLLLPLPWLLAGCEPEGCLTGADGCVVPSPCQDLAFTCDGGSTEVYTLGASDTYPTENDTLAAAGDIVLANEQIIAVIEALDHPHYIGPTGGGLIDLYSRGQANDSLRHIFPATGVLPGDAVHYESVELLDEGDVKAVQLLGRLDGYPDVRVATRYEIRPCEPGVRIRTEMVNGTDDSLSWFPTDAFYFGDRGSLPFVPGKGMGFTYPTFGLSTLADGFVDAPYMATNAYAGEGSAYAAVACSEDHVAGFHSSQISAVGMNPLIVPPRDYTIYERFIAATGATSVAGAADIALEVRRQLFGEAFVTLTGTVSGAGGTLGEGLRASVLVSEGSIATPTDERTPWTHVRPAADGTWSVRVPADKAYVVTAEAFGRAQSEVEVTVGTSDASVPALVIDDAAEVTINAMIDTRVDHMLVFVVPADDATEEATNGEMFGHFGECAPLLGNPHGPSPACNRVLVDGPTTIAMPPGTYDFYTVAGPFSTLGAALGVVVEAGTGQSVSLDVDTLDLQPEGTLSGDFHVHGGASFDSAIPDTDRVKAILASQLQIVATTEHDTVWDYSTAADALGAADRIHLISGTESTGHVLFPLRSDFGFPSVIGHWNFWPVDLDPQGPYRGASWDELAEPGALMERQATDGNFDPDIGVIQLNHPVGGLQFGRDYGWISASGLDLDEPPSSANDKTSQALYLHTPDGASTSNADYDVQEVMNGTKNELLVGYRQFWFYLLQHGIIRAGTANSDSHTLTENVMGTPRTIVTTETTMDDFDLATFNEDVRLGHSFGTNGPVLEVDLDGVGPSVDLLAGGTTLTIRVSAAPWVPVDEVRIVVNGEVVRTITDLTAPTDPFGSDGLVLLDTTIPLSELVTGDDAWLVVEAGTALAENIDLDCNGVFDTGDNNGDGTIDASDVDTDGDLVITAADADLPPIADDAGCLDTVGPLAEPPEPDRGTRAWLFAQVTPKNGYPMSFTNPFLLDLDGDGTFTGVDQ
jgi:hypothetical protein